ncbi:hypothetical protein BGZ70_001796 [Mortierella alpina]|uniref:Uncharacterized protein n=1 Tax=Mortierella alpina TaxID=64518 RepID=A0A9P6LWN1_MORAP|nr:hypothetical protein BGZ70_001796 [Mortierella alpina]
MPATSGPIPMTRQHDEAVLFSCHQLHASNAEQKRTLGIIDALELEPFTMTDAEGAEQNALAHTSIVAKLSTGQVKVCPNPVTSLKRKHAEDDPCVRCFPAQAPGLEYVFSVSPYASSLNGRKFLELDQSVCELFNRDWEFSPHLRFACARILAGCILLNNCNGQAVIANTIEVYGRTKLVDAHREPFVVRKDKPVATSLPPSFKTPYSNVWPVTIMSPEGERLVLGTSSFDALVTSSLRLDAHMRPSVGGTTSSFVLSSAKDSLATRIFLDEESLTVGLQLAAERDTWSVSHGNLIWQLRQTKTKFHDPSSYYLCRASSHFARNHTCQPYSMFSLAAFDQAHNGDGAAISRLFHAIATGVIRDAGQALLDKTKVEDLRAGCSQKGKAAKGLDGVLSLFGKDHSSMKIIGNRELNKHLEVLAPLLSTYIARANGSVVPFLEREFTALENQTK